MHKRKSKDKEVKEQSPFQVSGVYISRDHAKTESYDYPRGDGYMCQKYGKVVPSVPLCPPEAIAVARQIGTDKLDTAIKYIYARLLEEDDFEFEIEQGYYGEEIGDCTVTFPRDYVKFDELPAIDKLKYVLFKENCMLLERLGTKVEIEKIDIKSIYYDVPIMSKKNPAIVADYTALTAKDRADIMPVVKISIYHQPIYRLIDGYHKLKACIDKKIKTCNVLVIT